MLKNDIINIKGAVHRDIASWEYYMKKIGVRSLCLMFFCFTLIGTFGCSKSPENDITTTIITTTTTTTTSTTTTTRPGRNYFPNNDGYSWHYNSSDGTSFIYTFEGTAVINGSLSVQNYKSTQIDSSGNPLSTSEAYYRINDAGVYFYGMPSYTTTEGWPLLLFPLEVGHSWTFYSFGSYRIVATIIKQETITVPAGPFNCFNVELVSYNGTVESSATEIWFGEGAGIVKETINNTTNDTMVLDSKNF